MENETWLEAAFENYGDACETKNWSLALAIAADVGDKGFSMEGEIMERKVDLLRKKIITYGN